MKALRPILLGCLLLGMAGPGCSQKEADNPEEVKKKEETKKSLVGVWVLEKSESDGTPGTDCWEFTGDGYEKKTTEIIKSLTGKSLALIGSGEKEPTQFKRKGAAPTGKKNKENIVGRWDTVPAFGFFDFSKDGKYVGGLVGNDKSDLVTVWGTFTVDGEKLTKTIKGEGTVKRAGNNPFETHYEIKGDKLIFMVSLEKQTYAIKSITDDKLVLKDQNGKRQEFKKTSKPELILGTWEVVQSDLGWKPGFTWEFDKEGKANVNFGGTKATGDYKVEGNTLKWTPPGKGEIPMTITTLAPTELVLVVEEGGKKKTSNFKKK